MIYLFIDNDDDGETAAGGRLLHLLQLVDARNVIVIVSRWYGGIQLGPGNFFYFLCLFAFTCLHHTKHCIYSIDRFKDINNVARDLLEKCGYVGSGGGGKSGGSKGGDVKKTKKK